MAVLKPRERLVYFRISEDEYRQFISICEQAGARSVSDLARNAVQKLITEGLLRHQEDQMDAKLRVLERLIEEVKQQLQILGAGGTNREAEASALAVAADGFLPEADQYDRGQKEQ